MKTIENPEWKKTVHCVPILVYVLPKRVLCVRYLFFPVLIASKNLSFPKLTSPLCPGVVARDRVLSTGQIELFDI